MGFVTMCCVNCKSILYNTTTPQFSSKYFPLQYPINDHSDQLPLLVLFLCFWRGGRQITTNTLHCYQADLAWCKELVAKIPKLFKEHNPSLCRAKQLNASPPAHLSTVNSQVTFAPADLRTLNSYVCAELQYLQEHEGFCGKFEGRREIPQEWGWNRMCLPNSTSTNSS